MHALRSKALSNKQALQPGRVGASRPARANKAATSLVVNAKLNDAEADDEERIKTTSTFSRIAAAAMASMMLGVATPQPAVADALSGSAYSKVRERVFRSYLGA